MLRGQVSPGRNVLSRLGLWWPRVSLGGALLAMALIASGSGPVVAGAESNSHVLVSGAGRTIIEGGSGGSSPVPVMTVLAFPATSQGGDFECLALSPAPAPGAGGGPRSGDWGRGRSFRGQCHVCHRDCELGGGERPNGSSPRNGDCHGSR